MFLVINACFSTKGGCEASVVHYSWDGERGVIGVLTLVIGDKVKPSSKLPVVAFPSSGLFQSSGDMHTGNGAEHTPKCLLRPGLDRF